MRALQRKTVRMKKRDCGISMKLVPYGGGWTDVYLDICGDSHYFIISGVLGNQFEDLLRVLYHMHPDNKDPENVGHIFDYKIGIVDTASEKCEIVKIVDEDCDMEPGTVFVDIPWRAGFVWDEEGSESRWRLERVPDQSTQFMLKIHIEHERDGLRIFDYEVPYQDFCYAVAKAYTQVLKEYGFFGYHCSIYTQDIKVRYLLFLKAVALDRFETRQVRQRGKGRGEASDLKKEMELLLFDM